MIDDKNKLPADVAVDEPVAVQVLKLGLSEFCTRLSVSVKKPELIAGFEHYERTNGRLDGTDSELQSRFLSYCNKPV